MPKKFYRSSIRNGQKLPYSVNRAIMGTLTLYEMFDKFMSYKRSEGLTPLTIEDYIHFRYLDQFIGGDLKNEEVCTDVFMDYTGYLLHEKKLKPTTVNVRIRTLRAFLRHCYIEGWIEEPIHETFKPVKTGEIPIQTFTLDEVKRLLDTPDDIRFVGFRDKVIMMILLDTMVRVSELSKIRRQDVDLKGGEIVLQPHITKTKRNRSVPLSNNTIKILTEYLYETEEFQEETLFVTYDGQPLNTGTIRKQLHFYGEIAGIKDKRVSPHIFRHTGAVLYILNGGDPFSLQRILGHTDMSMVRRYEQNR
ncbi:tyrosine-type recombinase/integrase [Evansella tamaricis]|uniref:Tyrosine-type recombinase/integrase n=1 Tax=Evansella tamaricis TaxID=2069301 RepID=A0ABS6JFF0_9BACI|nr:tyrosine-type recombinase/integrase [Evansella tamaricis]MBU9712394.1 tyrosine-type recombinase/integrase [Evansella tamaricis]